MGKINSFKSNLSWIFIGNITHSFFSFLLNIVVARLLTKAEYGLINYATAWIALYNALVALGLNGIINKYTTEDKEQSNVFLSTAVICRCISSIIGIVATVLTIYLINSSEYSLLLITFIQSLSLLFGAGDTLVFWFRYKREANIVAIIRIVAFGLSAIIRIIALVILKSIYVYSLGVVLESFFFSIILIIQYRKKYSSKIILSISAFKTLIRHSYPFIFSAVLVTVYAQTDRIMLKNMLSNEAVANYSIAYTVAGLASVVVSAIVEGFRPELFRYKNNDEEKYKMRLKQAYFFTFWLSTIYCIIIALFPKIILTILYGNKYTEAAFALSVVVWYTSFSYLGTINNIYLVIENKEKWVYIATLTGAVCNIIINFLLIPSNGIVGAALASLISQMMANYIILLIIPDLRPLSRLIIKGIAEYQNISFSKIKNLNLHK